MTAKKCVSTCHIIDSMEDVHIPVPTCFCVAQGIEDADLGSSGQLARGRQVRFFLAHQAHAFRFLLPPPSCGTQSSLLSFQHGPQNAYKGDEHMRTGFEFENDKRDPWEGGHPLPVHQNHPPHAGHQHFLFCAASAWEGPPALIWRLNDWTLGGRAQLMWCEFISRAFINDHVICMFDAFKIIVKDG
jgi:hypothetical protein